MTVVSRNSKPFLLCLFSVAGMVVGTSHIFSRKMTSFPIYLYFNVDGAKCRDNLVGSTHCFGTNVVLQRTQLSVDAVKASPSAKDKTGQRPNARLLPLTLWSVTSLC